MVNFKGNWFTLKIELTINKGETAIRRNGLAYLTITGIDCIYMNYKFIKCNIPVHHFQIQDQSHFQGQNFQH